MQQEILGSRYQLHEVIGKGGMGMIYRATDRLIGQDVALKRIIVDTEKLLYSTYIQSEYAHILFAQEFNLVASLRHPNIISVLDYGFTSEQKPYFTMELLERPKNVIEVGVSQPLEYQLTLIVQLLQALAYMHRRGIVHRDLKPSNVLFSSLENEVKVVDFGLSLTIEQAKESAWDIAGTLAYAAPEILAGSPSSESSDLYVVGLIAYEMLTGSFPYDRTSLVSLIEDISNKLPSVAGIPPRVANVILRLLAKHPEDRYQNASEALRALSNVLDKPVPIETEAIRESFLQAARFVGRKQELAQLVDALNLLREGKGSGWLIGGESGAGKSRLINELRLRALVSEVQVVRGQATAEGGPLYMMWRDILRHLCLQIQLSDLEASVIKVIVPDIGSILNREIPDAPPIDPQLIQKRLFDTVAGICLRITQPFVLLMEDLQWAAESGVLLKRVLEIVDQVPLLIIGTFRNDEKAELPSELPGMKVISLQRLSQSEIADLSASILGEDIGRKATLVDLLKRETEGNILFIVEVLRALAERAGQLSQIVNIPLPSQVFSGGIQRIVQRRLSRIPEIFHSGLNLAAIAGRDLDPKLLQQFIPDLDGWLLACGDAVVIEVSDNTWRFSHDKIREGILQALSAAEVVDLNRQIAEAMEQTYKGSPDKIVRLAYHWNMAGNTAKELEYSILAGEQALQNAVFGEAIRHLQRAVELVRQMPVDAAQVQTELKVQMTLGVPLLMTRGYASPEVGAAFARAYELCQIIGDTPQLFAVIRGLWSYYSVFGSWERSDALARQMLAQAEMTNASEMLVEAYWAMGSNAMHRGIFVPAEQYFLKCLAVYDPEKHSANALLYGQDPGVTAMAYLVWLEWLLGYPERAEKYQNQAIDLAKRLKHDFSLCFAYIYSATMHKDAGNAQSCKDIADANLAVAGANNFLFWLALGMIELGWALPQLGEPEAGMAQMQQGLELISAVGTKLGMTHHLHSHADTLANTNKIDEALQVVEKTLTFAAEYNENYYIAELHRLKGDYLLKKDRRNLEDALQQYHKAINIAQEQQALGRELTATMSLSRVLQSEGNNQDAYRMLSAVYARYTEGFETQKLREAKQLLAELAPA